MTRPRGTARRRPLRTALFAGATLVAVVVGAEVVLRLAGAAHERIAGAALRRDGQEAGSFVILTYGGSFVKGLPECSYPAEMEKLLAARHPQKRLRVINMARRAFGNTSYLLERLPADIATFRPSLVVLNFNFRENGLRHRPRGGWPARLRAGLRSLVEESRIARLLRYHLGAYSIDSINQAGVLEQDAVSRFGDSPAGLVAQARWHEVMEDMPLAERAYLKALKQEDSAATRLELGNFYLKQGRYAAAKKHLERSLEQKPDPETHLSLAQACRYLGDDESMEKHIAEIPRRGPPAMKLARWFQSEGDYARAEKIFKEALAEGGGANARLSLARFYVDRDRFAEAEALLRAALNEPGSRAAAHRSMAYFHKNRGDRAAAEREIKRALALGDDDETRMELAYFYIQQGRYPEAEREVSIVAERKKDLESYMTLARVHEEQGDYAGMEAALRKALAVHESPRVYAKLFVCYLESGNYAAAEATMDKAYGVRDSESYVSQRRRLHIKSGRPDLARDYEPSFETLRENLERIIRLCRANGVALYFDNTSLTSKPMENAIRETARRNGIPFIDVMREYDALPEEEKSRVRGGQQHFSAYGYKWLARLIGREVEDALE